MFFFEYILYQLKVQQTEFTFMLIWQNPNIHK